MRQADLKNLKNELRSKIKPGKKIVLERFFKTGKGEYSEGDKFLGIMVPDIRLVIKDFYDMDLGELDELVKSEYHEERLTALLIAVKKFERGDAKVKKDIYDFYLRNTGYINNWDLVDLSADRIVGAYLEDKDRGVLKKLAVSKSLWERRIAMLSTFNYIKKGDSETAFEIADVLLMDDHDLIQKAVGWMLREIGKRCNEKLLIEYLDKHAKDMPRTALRYAIERLPENMRKYYLEMKKRG